MRRLPALSYPPGPWPSEQPLTHSACMPPHSPMGGALRRVRNCCYPVFPPAVSGTKKGTSMYELVITTLDTKRGILYKVHASAHARYAENKEANQGGISSHDV